MSFRSQHWIADQFLPGFDSCTAPLHRPKTKAQRSKMTCSETPWGNQDQSSGLSLCKTGAFCNTGKRSGDRE